RRYGGSYLQLGNSRNHARESRPSGRLSCGRGLRIARVALAILVDLSAGGVHQGDIAGFIVSPLYVPDRSLELVGAPNFEGGKSLARIFCQPGRCIRGRGLVRSVRIDTEEG